MKFVYVVIVSGFLLVGSQCTEAPEEKKESTASVHKKDGKWVVDQKMNAILIEMEELVLSLPQDIAVDEINSKGEELNDLIIQLIKSCSMKGEAHDALHELLEPLMEACEQMQSEASAEEGMASAKELMTIYKHHFVSE